MKRFLSTVIAIVMILGTMAITTFAEETTVAKIGDTEYETLAAAVAEAEKGDTITVITDIELAEPLTIPAGKEITLDLNGQTVSQTKAQTGGYQMILNDGSLTINNGVGDGKISYTDSGNGGEYISDTIYNRGILVINGGTIENLSSATVAKNGYPHAVDTYSGIRDTSVTINGGTIYCASYSAIRMFCVSATNKADLVINKGTIKGAIDMQNGTTAEAEGTLDINGGTFETTANVNNIRFANWNGGATTYGITASISNGNFNGGITKAYVPAEANWDSKIVSGGTFSSDVSDWCVDGYECEANEDGTFGVIEKMSAPDLPTATVTETGKNVTVDAITYDGVSIGKRDLTFTMNFKAVEPTEAQKLYYDEYYADFVLTINKDIRGTDGCYLAGSYENWKNGGWVIIEDTTNENVLIPKNTQFRIISSMYKVGIPYETIYSFVKEFDCGIYFSEEFLAANPDLEVTLELRMYEDENDTTGVTIGNTYTYTAKDAVVDPDEATKKALQHGFSRTEMARADNGRVRVGLYSAIDSPDYDHVGIDIYKVTDNNELEYWATFTSTTVYRTISDEKNSYYADDYDVYGFYGIIVRLTDEYLGKKIVYEPFAMCKDGVTKISAGKKFATTVK